MLDSVIKVLNDVRNKTPLIHAITNNVVINDNANALLSFGASPAMVVSPDEAYDFTAISKALYINIGTINDEIRHTIINSTLSAKEHKVPVVVDPVGCAAIKSRVDFVKMLLKIGNIDIIKGNIGEIKALFGVETKARGVDSLDDGNDAPDICYELANSINTTIVATGKFDYISDSRRKIIVKNGTEMFTKITGAGCTLGAIMAATRAVCDDCVLAALTALLAVNIAGELAAEESTLPGTFRTKFYDYLYILNGDLIKERAKFEEIGGKISETF